jgi:hypothetical protein
MSLGDLGIGSINGGPIGTKNVIINGNFGINQRGVSGTVTLAAGAYGHDRWKAGASGCTYTFATSNNVTTLTISSGSLIQVIEGLNLYSGTYTLSWTGTAQGKIGAGSYAGSGVTGAAVGGTNLNIEFNTGTLSFVQFEQGSVATPFERRPYGTELQLAQRYFARFNSLGGSYRGVGAGVSESATSISCVVKYPVTMRSGPTASGANMATYDGSSVRAVTAFSTQYTGSDGLNINLTVGGGGMTTNRPANLISDNSGTGYFDLSAEL